LTNSSGVIPSADSKAATTMVQKYLTVIDLTSGDSTESSDQSMMLAALIDRLKGIYQALNSVGESSSQANTRSVLDLYAW
jgi:mediator of RNA polymerase II transcription subunit 12